MKDADIRQILRDTEVFVADWIGRDPRQTGVIEKALNLLSVQSAALTEIAKGAYCDLDFTNVVDALAEQSHRVGMEPPDAITVRSG